MADEGTATCIDILLAILLPPLGVFLKYGCKVVKLFLLFHANFKSKLSAIMLYNLEGLIFVFLQAEFWICLVLTFFGYIPGIIYAVYAITK